MTLHIYCRLRNQEFEVAVKATLAFGCLPLQSLLEFKKLEAYTLKISQVVLPRVRPGAKQVHDPALVQRTHERL